MNFGELKLFIRDILKKAQCPHCSGSMGIGKVEILDVKDTSFVFRTTCKSCGAEPIIQGNIKSKKSVDFRNNQRNPGKSVISKQAIQGIASRLANFSGKNVKDLF
jgi:cytochrome c5